MKLQNTYFNNVREIVTAIEKFETDKINLAADKIAETTAAGGIVHLFGSGHSVLSALEVYIRAGAFSNSKPIIKDTGFDRFERIPGVGKALMKMFDGQPGEVIFVFSNSGRNNLPIEIAKQAKERGLFVIGITSFEHVKRVRQTLDHLVDSVDLAIDTHVPYGDASVKLPNQDIKMAPLSTVANVTLLHAIYCEAAERLLALGVEPPVRVSRNTPEGDRHNKKFIDLYADRIPELRY